MPVWGLWLEGAIWFSTHPRSQKGRNLASSPEVVVHLESGDEVAIVEGVAEPVRGGDLLARFIDEYEAKYGYRIGPERAALAVYSVRPRMAFAWREADFPASATRWRFEDA
jgi:Pyridoxamine 5'-phosphate oxidase